MHLAPYLLTQSPAPDQDASPTQIIRALLAMIVKLHPIDPANPTLVTDDATLVPQWLAPLEFHIVAVRARGSKGIKVVAVLFGGGALLVVGDDEQAFQGI